MAGLRKILLVEDNPQIVEIYTTVLKGGHYELETATTVDEALEIAKNWQPDLIFLDIMLPGGRSGLDALMLLRTDPRYKSTTKKIVMLTNLGLSDKMQKMWEEYADGYAIKAEISPHELVDIIKSFETPLS